MKLGGIVATGTVPEQSARRHPASRRRRYAIALAVLVAMIGILVLRSVGSVYESRVEVRFLTAGENVEQDVLERPDGSLVPFVLAVEQRLNQGQPVLRTNSREASLSGLGRRDGYAISLPNYGSQWQTSFPVPSLVVDVVAPTEAEAAAKRDAEIARIQTTVQQLQTEQGIAEEDWIRAEPVWDAETSAWIGPTPLGLVRGLAAFGVIAVIAGIGGWSFLARRGAR